AQSARELVAEVIAAAPPEDRLAMEDARPAEPLQVSGDPLSANTLTDALLLHVEHHGDFEQTSLVQDDGSLSPLTYNRLYDNGCRVACGLRRLGLAPGDTVLIMLPTSADYLTCFAGVLLAGLVPVPIYPPVRVEQAAEHVRRHAGIVDSAGTRVLVTTAAMAPLARGLDAGRSTRLAVATPEALLQNEPMEPHRAAPGDLALLQYTSGSTGQPKGVALTHANLLANMRALARRLSADPNDVFVSWLPLYHDMGLIGAWLGTLCYGCRLVLMSPLRFLMDPSRWLRAISAYGGTLSAAPNFAYELCLRRVRDEDIAGIDLSHWRHALNGAEPVRADTVRQFSERFARYGLAPTAVKPVYGLAESTVGLTVPDVDERYRIDRLTRDAFQRDGRAVEAGADDTGALEYVACGHPIDGHEVRIVDDGHDTVAERQEGFVEFRGPSATRGYHGSPDATAALFRGDWLKTGDRGYLRDGRLYVTGRVKDVIIRGGRNIHPTELDDIVGAVDGVRRGCVATFGDADAAGSDKLIVVAETRITDAAQRETLSATVRERLLDQAQVAPDRIVWVQPHTVLKTSSGKIRRADTRELYRRNRLGTGRFARFRQRATLWRWAIAERVGSWFRTGSAGSQR
ncbi:MAG: fatty acyl-AMP ligase, partial [Pseudomonadota bacterium]